MSLLEKLRIWAIGWGYFVWEGKPAPASLFYKKETSFGDKPSQPDWFGQKPKSTLDGLLDPTRHVLAMAAYECQSHRTKCDCPSNGVVIQIGNMHSDEAVVIGKALEKVFRELAPEYFANLKVKEIKPHGGTKTTRPH